MLSEKQQLAIYGAAIVLFAALAPGVASAYVGPGLGLGAIASFFSIIGAIFLAIVGFIWYPIKRLIRMFRRPKDAG
jgi:hypothetical protein